MQKLLTILALSLLFCPGIGSGDWANSGSAHAAEQLYTTQPSVTPALAIAGKWSVGVTTLDVINPNQLSATDFQSRIDRPLIVEVWYPSNVQTTKKRATYKDVTRLGKSFELQGRAYRNASPVKGDIKFPLVVLSHGYTGYRTMMFYLAEHLASHGYVVASIDHTDSTNAEIDFLKNPGAGFPSTLINRARDQQFILDFFAAQNSTLTSLADTDKAAVIGYSMGGYGALNTIGACYNFNSKILQSLGFPAPQTDLLVPIFNSCSAGLNSVDKRWKAMIAFSPWGGELNVHTPESMRKIRIPSLFVAGSQDDVSGYENGIKKLYKQLGAADKYLLVYDNARHNIAAHPAPKIAYDNDIDIGHYFEPSWNSETINRINTHMSLAFLDCHVKGRDKACAILPQHEDGTQTKQIDGKLSPAWAGFKERWNTGLTFYRE